MVVSGDAGAEPPEDINDDLARETFFYEQALSSANVAIRNLKDLGIAVKRPDDFYAEMVKSDEHMKRVRAELIFEQTQQVRVNTKSQRVMLFSSPPPPPPGPHRIPATTVVASFFFSFLCFFFLGSLVIPFFDVFFRTRNACLVLHSRFGANEG